MIFSKGKMLEYSIISMLLLLTSFNLLIDILLIEETSCEQPNVSCDIEFHLEKMKQITGQDYTNDWNGYFDKYPDIMHRITIIPSRLFNISLTQSFKIMRVFYLLTVITLVSVIIGQHGGKTIHKLITTLLILQTGIITLTFAGMIARTGVLILLLLILITKKQSNRNVLMLLIALTHHYGFIIAIATYVITQFTRKSKYESHMICLAIIFSAFLGQITKIYLLIQAHTLATTMAMLLFGLIISKQDYRNT